MLILVLHVKYSLLDSLVKFSFSSPVGTQSQLKCALEAGATDFIQKPFSKEQIIEALQKHIG